MLQSLREKTQGWPAKIIFVVLIFVFSFFGIESYFVSRTETFVAKVGKDEVSQQDYQNRMNDLRRQMAQEQGDQFDPSYFDKPEVKDRVLNALIDQQLLLKANKDLGMTVSNAQIRQEIASIPAFQVDGHFDKDSYVAALAGQGMSPAGFEDKVRASLQIQLLPKAIAASAIVTEADVDRYLSLRLQTRDLRFAQIPRPALTDSQVDDSEIAAYYKAHKAEFMTPEQVSLNYLELNAADLKSDSTPDEDTLRQRYAQEKQRFVQPEQRRVSHILVKVPENATPAQQKAALAKARMIDKEARSGADFAKLAEKYSDDLGSKRQGGDLGWIERGVTNKAFEDALFAMKKGQISDPVLSPEGYHIIDLRDVRAGKVKPFAEVRADLLKEEQDSARERKYSDLAGKITDKVYADPSSLEPVAQELGLKLKHVGPFTRDGAKDGLAADPKVVKAAFSDPVLVQGNSSDPIELGTNHMVVIHVDQHHMPKERPLAEVRDTIRQKILDERVAREAKRKADALFAQLNKQGDLAKVAGTANVGVQPVKGALRMQNGVPQKVLEQAFKMPHPASGKPQYAQVDLGDGSYALVALDAVHPGDLKKVAKPQRAMLAAQMRQAYGSVATQDFIDAMRAHTEIKIARERM